MPFRPLCVRVSLIFDLVAQLPFKARRSHHFPFQCCSVLSFVAGQRQPKRRAAATQCLKVWALLVVFFFHFDLLGLLVARVTATHTHTHTQPDVPVTYCGLTFVATHRNNSFFLAKRLCFDNRTLVSFHSGIANQLCSRSRVHQQILLLHAHSHGCPLRPFDLTDARHPFEGQPVRRWSWMSSGRLILLLVGTCWRSNWPRWWCWQRRWRLLWRLHSPFSLVLLPLLCSKAVVRSLAFGRLHGCVLSFDTRQNCVARSNLPSLFPLFSLSLSTSKLWLQRLHAPFAKPHTHTHTVSWLSFNKRIRQRTNEWVDELPKITESLLCACSINSSDLLVMSLVKSVLIVFSPRFVHLSVHLAICSSPFSLACWSDWSVGRSVDCLVCWLATKIVRTHTDVQFNVHTGHVCSQPFPLHSQTITRIKMAEVGGKLQTFICSTCWASIWSFVAPHCCSRTDAGLLQSEEKIRTDVLDDNLMLFLIFQIHTEVTHTAVCLVIVFTQPFRDCCLFVDCLAAHTISRRFCQYFSSSFVINLSAFRTVCVCAVSIAQGPLSGRENQKMADQLTDLNGICVCVGGCSNG